MPFDHIQVTVSDLTTAHAQFDAAAENLANALQQVQNQI